VRRQPKPHKNRPFGKESPNEIVMFSASAHSAVSIPCEENFILAKNLSLDGPNPGWLMESREIRLLDSACREYSDNCRQAPPAALPIPPETARNQEPCRQRLCLKEQAPDRASALALCRLPASRRPSTPRPGSTKGQATSPSALAIVTAHSRLQARSLAVVSP
jgi:hypothetical protein